jgi:hypothetical protein
MRYIIGSTGEVWDPYGQRILAVMGDPEPDYDVVSYAVKNLGFVEVSTAEDGRETTIRFRWLAVTDRALATTERVLAGLAAGSSVQFVVEEHVWQTYSFAEPQDALAWLQEARSSRDAVSRDVTVVARDLDGLSNRRLSNRLETSDDMLALLFKKWRMSGQTFTPDVANFIVRFGLIDRAVLARKTDHAILFEHIGSRLNVYDGTRDGWQFQWIGRPVSEQPDPNFGRYTEEKFRDVLDKHEPAFDHVDAVIRNRQGSHRSRYDRLILPWKSDIGAPVVTTLSYKTDPDVSLASA